MKNFLLVLSFLSIGIFSYAQESESKNYKNEVGVDLTPLIKQFLNFDNNSYYQINPYYLMYRRHFGKTAIRVGIGGNNQKMERVSNDTDVTDIENTVLDFRLGIERKENFAKRWQFFYGLDLWANSTRYYTSQQYQSGGQSVGYDSKKIKYGVAPFLGFRYRINQRLSITTETNFQFYKLKETDERIYTPDNSLNTIQTNDGVQSSFNPPASIFITFDF